MTSDQAIKRQFADYGVTIRQWAEERGFSEGLVYAVIAGKSKGTRGQSHKIAVALGLKPNPAGGPKPDFMARVSASDPGRAIQSQPGGPSMP